LTAHTFHNFLRGSDAPPVELLRPQHSSPGVKNLNNLSTRPELAHQIVNRGLYEDVNQACEIFRVTIGEMPGRSLIRGRFTSHHISRYGPRSSAKTDQRRSIVERRLYFADRFVNRRHHAVLDGLSDICKRCGVTQRLELRSLASQKFDFASKRERYDQDVGK
jgi:hypothetical protein